MNTEVTFQGTLSNMNLPAFWESRTEKNLITKVEMICEDNFHPKKAIFLNRAAGIDKMYHVIFVAKIGDIITRALRINKTGVINYYFHLVTNTSMKVINGKNKVSIITEQIFSSSNEDEIVEEFGDEITPFLTAIKNKMDSDAVESFWSQPHNLHEKIAAAK